MPSRPPRAVQLPTRLSQSATLDSDRRGRRCTAADDGVGLGLRAARQLDEVVARHQAQRAHGDAGRLDRTHGAVAQLQTRHEREQLDVALGRLVTNWRRRHRRPGGRRRATRSRRRRGRRCAGRVRRGSGRSALGVTAPAASSTPAASTAPAAPAATPGRVGLVRCRGLLCCGRRARALSARYDGACLLHRARRQVRHLRGARRTDRRRIQAEVRQQRRDARRDAHADEQLRERSGRGGGRCGCGSGRRRGGRRREGGGDELRDADAQLRAAALEDAAHLDLELDVVGRAEAEVGKELRHRLRKVRVVDRHADAAVVRVQPQAAAVLARLDAAAEERRPVAAAVRQLHRDDDRVVVREQPDAPVERGQRAAAVDAAAPRRKRAVEHVLVVQVRAPPDRRRAVRVVDEREGGVAALGRRRKVVRGLAARLRLHAQQPARAAAAVRAVGGRRVGRGRRRSRRLLDEQLAKEGVVLDHRPRHQVLGVVGAREPPQQRTRGGGARRRVLLEGGVVGRGVVAHARARVPPPRDLAARVDVEEERERVARHARVERQLAVRQLGRQHRHRAVGRVVGAEAAVVGRAGALRRPLEERRVARQPRRHVRHVDAARARQLEAAAVPLDRERVVDVLGADIIDGEGVERRAVEPAVVGAELLERREAPDVGLRVAARLDAKVQLARPQLGSVLADVAEQLHEGAFHGALLDLDLRVLRTLSRLLERRLLHANDAVLAAAVEPHRGHAVLAESVLAVELDHAVGVGGGHRSCKALVRVCFSAAIAFCLGDCEGRSRKSVQCFTQARARKEQPR